MTGNQVNISVSTTDKNTENVLNRIERSVDKLENKFAKVGRAGQRAGRKTKSGFDSALATFGKFSGAIANVGGLVGGVAIAANKVRVQLDHIERLNQKDDDTQVTFEDALAAAFKNSSGLFEPEELKNIVLGVEGKTGVSPTKIAAALSSAFSAKGPKTKEQGQEAIEATIAALRFSPKIPTSETADLTGAGIDLSKRFGFSPEESLGFLQNVGGQARVVEPAMLANNVTPAIANLANFGNTAQEAGALVAAVTQGSTDKKAASTGTAVIALASQLRKRGIGENTAEGIDILANDPEQRKRFLEGGKFNGKKFPAASFEKGSEVAIQQLFQEGSVTRDAFKEGVRVIGGNKEAQKTFEMMIKAAKILTPASGLRRESEAAAEVAHIRDAEGGRRAGARKLLENAFDAANLSSIKKSDLVTGVGSEFQVRTEGLDQDPLKVAESILERERKKLLSEKQLAPGNLLDPFRVLFPNQREVSDKDKLAAEALRKQEKIIERQISQQEKLIKAQQENTEEMKKTRKALEKQQQNNKTPAPIIVPPPRRAPYKAPAEQLSLTSRVR